MAHSIGKRIAKLRESKSWTQGELADKLSVTDKVISKWEKGDDNPDISMLPLLADILGVTIDELLTGKNKTTVTNGSVYERIASGELDLLDEIERGISVDGFDEYHKSLADYCAEKNNIKVFRLLIKLNIVTIIKEFVKCYDFETGSMGRFPTDKSKLYDRAYDKTGKYGKQNDTEYDDSALFCLAVKNREDSILRQLSLAVRPFTENEADCIIEDFDYFYKNYFTEDFPSYIGILIQRLVRKGQQKKASKLLNLISQHKRDMEQKCQDCEKEYKSSYYGTYKWTINWQSVRQDYSVIYDRTLKRKVAVKNVITAYCSNPNDKRSRIIGNAIVFTNEDITAIGFADSSFLDECRKLGYEPELTPDLIKKLLEKDDLKLFEAFTVGQTLDVESERVILNSDGKIKTAYMKNHTPQNINDVIAASDVDLLLSMLSTPKAVLQYSKEVSLESLGSKKMFPVLQKIIPFLEKTKLNKLLNEIVETDNVQARLLLIEAGATLYKTNEYGEKVPDKIQTEILYRLLKTEDR